MSSLPMARKLSQADSAGYLPTPPTSAPDSNRLRGEFTLNGQELDVAQDGTTRLSPSLPQSSTFGSQPLSRKPSSNSLFANDLNHDGAKLRKRPSLIVTTENQNEPPREAQLHGLALDFDSMPAMRTNSRRAYPIDPAAAGSPLPSPLLPSQTLFSSSPLASPVSATFTKGQLPTTTSPNLSPNLSSLPMERRESTGSRLSAVTDPLGRLATGLVRRASSSSLKGDLPVSVSRSPSPSILSLPPSPTLSITPNFESSAVEFGNSLSRRNPFSDKNGKEKEKND